jgi:hypothetical protein
MRFLKTNTAVIVTVGPFYDRTDGVTIEGALTITNERITAIKDTDDGNAPTIILDNVTGATSATDNDLNYITNNDAGLMQLEFTAANVNFLGRLFLSITDAANHVPVFHEFMVISAQMWDAMFGTGNLNADVVNWKGSAAPAMTGDAFARLGAPAGASIAADLVTIAAYIDTEIAAILVDTGTTLDAAIAAVKAQTDLIPATPAAVGSAMTLAADALDAAALKADAIAEIVAGIKAAVVEAEGTITLQQALSIILAVLAGVTTAAGATIKDPSGAATRVDATINTSSERTAMTLTPSA